MIPCKHKDRIAQTLVVRRVGGRQLVRLKCDRCGAWLSLGHSDETPERVAIEIRAAEIAESYPTLHSVRRAIDDGGTDGAEYAGWLQHAFDSQKHPEQFGELAGYLARAIATHEET